MTIEHVDHALTDHDHAGGDMARLGDPERLVEVRVHGRRRGCAVEHALLGGDRGLQDRRCVERYEDVLDMRAPREVAERLPSERHVIANGEQDRALE